MGARSLWTTLLPVVWALIYVLARLHVADAQFKDCDPGQKCRSTSLYKCTPAPGCNGWNLYAAGLKGTLPSSMGSLPLMGMILSSNMLSGTLPYSFGSLDQMIKMDLYNNAISGTIPESFGSLNKLSGMYLYGNKLTGTLPNSLGSLRRLREIFLYDNAFSGTIPASYGSMNQLTGIRLSSGNAASNSLSGSVPKQWCTLPSDNCELVGGNDLCLPPECGKKKWCGLKPCPKAVAPMSSGCTDKSGPVTINGHSSTCDQLVSDCASPFVGAIVSQHCAKTCGTACDDNPAPLLMAGKAFSCADLARDCGSAALGEVIAKHCPHTCCACSDGTSGTDDGPVVVHGRGLRGQE